MTSTLATYAPMTLFVGRQPICDRDLDAFGYELLFRRDATVIDADVVDGRVATARVLVNAITEIGLDNLVGNKRAFVNLTEQFIVEPDLIVALPTDRVVLEVLETVPPTPEVIAGLTRLHDLGFTIAMDDFEYSEEYEPLLALSAIVKYDYGQIRGPRLRARIDDDHRAGRRVIVERLETQREFRAALTAGADLFQGYFFAKPATITATAVPPNRLTLLQLLARVSDPDTPTDEIIGILARDVAMSVKTLRYVNSAAGGVATPIDSIEHAAILLGRDKLRSWTSLTLIAAMDDQPTELISLALLRARACENLARVRNRLNPASYYTAGMLSLLDAITGVAMERLVVDLALNDEIRACLVGDHNDLRDVLDTVITFERDDVGAAPTDTDTVAAYREALVWTTDLVAGMNRVQRA